MAENKKAAPTFLTSSGKERLYEKNYYLLLLKVQGFDSALNLMSYALCITSYPDSYRD
jgi:hypothetical protein